MKTTKEQRAQMRCDCGADCDNNRTLDDIDELERGLAERDAEIARLREALMYVSAHCQFKAANTGDIHHLRHYVGEQLALAASPAEKK